MSETNQQASGFLDRTLGNLTRVWSEIAETTRHYVSNRFRPDLSGDDAVRLRADLEAFLDAKGDEATLRSRAADLGQIYLTLNAEGRTRFFAALADGFAVDRAAVDAAIEEVRAAGTDEGKRHRAERTLSTALEPRWRALLARFTSLPEGMKFLVDMRAEMLQLRDEAPGIRALADDLRVMLANWFDIGLLSLHRIDWQSPASLLEKLISYESVHAIRSWDDLKNRLDYDRRCFAFFHPNMADEPLIFVQVALVKGMSASVDQLLDESAPGVDPQTADAAIFYSISNAQSGLTGISFGNFLIKRVVADLQGEFPNLKTFATLSPIPGFRDWLGEKMADPEAELLTPTARRMLEEHSEAESDAGLLQALLGRVEWGADRAEPEAGEDEARWSDGEDALRVLADPMKRLAALYLTGERRGGKQAQNSVAHFHLSNGARVERLNWRADLSDHGCAQSWGLMVNYLYNEADIAANSEAYLVEHKIVQSSTIAALTR